MTLYGYKEENRLLGDYADSSKFENITGKALESIPVGSGVKFDDQFQQPKPDYMVRPYYNVPVVLWLPMIGVAVRDRKLIIPTGSPEGTPPTYELHDSVAVMVSGRVNVAVRDGLQVYQGQEATINTNGKFGSDLGELYVGTWMTSGLGGTNLCVLELDVSETNTFAG